MYLYVFSSMATTVHLASYMILMNSKVDNVFAVQLAKHIMDWSLTVSIVCILDSLYSHTTNIITTIKLVLASYTTNYMYLQG